MLQKYQTYTLLTLPEVLQLLEVELRLLMLPRLLPPLPRSPSPSLRKMTTWASVCSTDHSTGQLVQSILVIDVN